MFALTVETLLMLAAAFILGAGLACVVRRSLFSATSRQATPAERRVDPLPEVAAARAKRFGGAAAAPSPQPAPAPAPQAPAAAGAPSPAPAEDLKRIRFIDESLEAQLKKLGVTRYEHIAAWTKPDVQRIGTALDLKKRIARENWIEQAQVLAKGGETLYASRRARGEAASAAPTPDEGEPRPIEPSPPQAVIPRPATPGAAGVAAAIAPAPPSPAPTPVRPSAAPPHVEERAAFATQTPSPPRPEPKLPEDRPPPPRPDRPPSPPEEKEDDVADVPPRPDPARMPQEAVPVRPAAPAARDNLQRISAIDADTEAKLVAHGIARYADIAGWSPADVERIDSALGLGGRIARENWVEQAQILSRGGDTVHSRAFDRNRNGAADGAAVEPQRPRPGLAGLRSVRSQAYQNAEPGPEAAARVGAQNKVPRAGPDDLKRIRGIGVLIEKKLNSMGVTSYEQIANWSSEDIERVSHSLDFKGRIERENWVEQARILASGGATEFSRRVDGGEVVSSRLKA